MEISLRKLVVFFKEFPILCYKNSKNNTLINLKYFKPRTTSMCYKNVLGKNV